MRKFVLLLPLIVACGGPAVWSPTTPSPVGTAAQGSTGSAAPRVHPEIHWSRNSAEHRALFLQTYRMATEQIRAAAKGKPSGWAVILDADETTLDNSTYQKRRADLDSAFTDATWNTWVMEQAAPALPGAVDFTRIVHDLGGKVVIVTNRDASVCRQTKENILADGIPADLVLCKPAGPSDKNRRFRAVQDGTASPGLRPLQVLMWVGDNIQDFPALTQAVRDSTASLNDFGRRFILLPNPMYGSWERNPYR